MVEGILSKGVCVGFMPGGALEVYVACPLIIGFAS